MSTEDIHELLFLGRSFMESRVLLTGVELNVFTELSRSPRTAEELAKAISADPRALACLLHALAAMTLLTVDRGVFAPSPKAARYLCDGSPESILPMARHSAGLWHRWDRLTAIVQGEPASQPTGNSAMAPDQLEAFIGAMHVVGAPQADRIVAEVAPGTARALIDIGGASGTYTAAFLRACPAMRATLFDREPVVEMARTRLTEMGMIDRVTFVGGDFRTNSLPGGHDLAFLSAIIHMNSPAENLALYKNVYSALVPGGRLIIRDHVMSADRTQPRAGALFAINMLVGTPGGGTYTLAEIRDDLETAGFTAVRLIADGDQMDQMVEAYRQD